MLDDPRKTCLGLQMHAQWYLSDGRRQMHRAYATLACWVILATGPQAAFMTGAEFSGPARHRVRASVTLTHPCQHASSHLPCTQFLPGRLTFLTTPDLLVLAQAPATAVTFEVFVITRAGTDIIPPRRAEERDKEEGDIQEDTSSGAAGGAGRVSLSFGACASYIYVFCLPPTQPSFLLHFLLAYFSFPPSLCPVYWERPRTSSLEDFSIWRAVFLSLVSFSFLLGMDQLLFATRWSSPFYWRS